MARQAGQAENLAHANARLSPTERLLRVLKALKSRHSEQNGVQEVRIELPMRRRELADLVGVRAETLARVVGQLQREGIASFDGRFVTLHGVPVEDQRDDTD